MSVKLALAKQRATPKQRDWLDSLSPDEAETLESALNHYGIDSFLKGWEFYRDSLDEARKFYP